MHEGTESALCGWAVRHWEPLFTPQNTVSRSKQAAQLEALAANGPLVVGAAYTHSANVAVFWISIALGGVAFAAPIRWSIPALIAPKGTVGTVGSVMNTVNILAGMPRRSLLAPSPSGRGRSRATSSLRVLSS